MNSVADPALASADDRIAAALAARGRLKDIDLARAQRLQAEAGGSLCSLLVRLGLVSERDMAEAAAEVLGLPLVSARDCPDAPPENVALSLRFVPSSSPPCRDSSVLAYQTRAPAITSRWSLPFARTL